MDINLKTISHKKQRYETVGDWIVKNGKLSAIYVSDMHNEDYEFLVGIHEAIEAWISLKNGVSQKSADDFDKAYEKARLKRVKAPCGCLPSLFSEPGNDRHAPYGKFHKFATKIEKMIAKKLKVNWKKYDDAVVNL